MTREGEHCMTLQPSASSADQGSSTLELDGRSGLLATSSVPSSTASKTRSRKRSLKRESETACCPTHPSGTMSELCPQHGFEALLERLSQDSPVRTSAWQESRPDSAAMMDGSSSMSGEQENTSISRRATAQLTRNTGSKDGTHLSSLRSSESLPEKPSDHNATVTAAMELARRLAQDSFLRLSGLPVNAGQGLSSWKTYPASGQQLALLTEAECGQQQPLSLKSWPKTGMCLDGYIWPLKMLERRTAERDGGAWRAWLTPNAMDSLEPRSPEALKEYNERQRPGRTTVSTLREQVIYPAWNTPSSGNFRTRGGDRKDEMGLDHQVKAWPTPDARDKAATGEESDRRRLEMYSTQGLQNAAKSWTTPQAHDRHGVRTEEQLAEARLKSKAGHKDLQSDVRSWGTPRKDEAKDSWATPASHDHHIGYQDRTTGKAGTQINVHTQAVNLAGGKATGQQLNPEWEELLMGWPLGWSDPANPCAGVWPGWPMPQGPEQFEYEPPRTISKGTMPNRTKRVEMVGNGVVPQCAGMAFALLMAGRDPEQCSHGAMQSK